MAADNFVKHFLNLGKQGFLEFKAHFASSF